MALPKGPLTANPEITGSRPTSGYLSCSTSLLPISRNLFINTSLSGSMRRLTTRCARRWN